MSYTGIKRSIRVKITRSLAGYPKYYPTDDDISQGYFTYNGHNYIIPDEEELAVMSQDDYETLVTALSNYIWSVEYILIDENFINENEEYDPLFCPTTTTTTTTEIILTADNTIITADSDLYTADNN